MSGTIQPFDVADVPEELRATTVCTRGSIEQIDPPVWPAGVRVDEIDLGDSADLERWLTVHRQAYGDAWTAADVEARVTDHPWFAVRHTYVAADSRAPVAIASIGTFRRNPAVGIGHYLGVVPSARGRGLAQAMLAHRYRHLRDVGIERAESHTHLGRLDAIATHFSVGFEPKTELDHWNPPPRPDAERFAAASEVLVGLHRRWRSAHGGD